MKYFFDSYAIIEILKGKSTYTSYAEEPVLTTVANLAEVKYYMLRTGESHQFRPAMERLRPDLLESTLSDWEKAAELRFSLRDKRMSLVDTLGYGLAQKHGLVFLTGDSAFENMPRVQYVK